MSTVSSLNAAGTCEGCGQPLLPGVDRCPACGREVAEAGSGRLVLVAVVVLLIAMFALTQYVVGRHRQTESSLARNWFSRGDRAMEAGYPGIAAEDYRTALTYDRENDEYRLRLAQSLLAANHFNEARSHLVGLWEEEPGDGEVNLTLARLFAKEGQPTEAVRYYRSAINGVWRQAAHDQRVATRFELVRYLLQHHDARQAEAELIALQADAPRDLGQQLQLADLLLQIGDAARAQGVYEGVLKLDGNNAEAWLGDGKASFAMGDYSAAQRELSAALEHDKTLTEAQEQLKLTREILRIAPGLRGLSIADRAQRVSQAFDTALQRLTSCAAKRGLTLGGPGHSTTSGPTGNTNSAMTVSGAAVAPSDKIEALYDAAMQKKNSATVKALRNNPDALEPTMDFVFEVEQATQPLCSGMSDTDQALLILANRQTQSLQ